ncbi:protein-tyrosine phosphatase-like protein [Halteromyces radiatus]|uniref:protein-tyrosine phosphatase-like protein n=1 Tax=Halteromyces radiatus TaxID=101107 RepID=UPI00221FD6D7|nr:protein-tyrosine phosphatase-like protein [Halteromyces radiatus]KAI8086492.1 protein-tyrosine phosphatase-like protein [Halteromyces radiatus]
MLTRSATLDNMTQQELDDFIAAYHTKTILDLRTSLEGKAGSAVDQCFPNINTLTKYERSSSQKLSPRQKICVNFVGYNFKRYFVFAACTFMIKIKLILMILFRQEQKAAYMISRSILDPLGLEILYQKFVTYCSTELRQALMVFTEPTNYPIHVQCSIGKDRTGLVIFLVLSICGVPEDVIVQDYAKTQVGLRPVYKELLDDIQRAGLSEQFLDASPKVSGIINKYPFPFFFLKDFY